MRGFYGIAVYHPKTEVNIGTLWRTANLMGARFLATIGHRYRRQSSDTLNTTDHIPLFAYDGFEDFRAHLPEGTILVAVELDDSAVMLEDFKHPERAVYLLGAEDTGIPPNILARCHRIVKINTPRSLNVAVAGSIVAYDRNMCLTKSAPCGKV